MKNLVRVSFIVSHDVEPASDGVVCQENNTNNGEQDGVSESSRTRRRSPPSR